MKFTTVKRAISAVMLDGYDADNQPEIEAVQGEVTFYPVMQEGDSVQVQTVDGPVTIVLSPITVRISDGIVMHRGTIGVQLFAGGEGSNPELIRWRARFTNLQSNGVTLALRDVIFDAIPGGEVDLTTAAPLANQPEPIVRGPQGVSLEALTVEGPDVVVYARSESGVQEMSRIRLTDFINTATQQAANLAAQQAAQSANQSAQSAQAAKSSETIAANFLAEVTPAAQKAVVDAIAADASITSAASSAVASQIQAQIAKIDQAALEPRATGAAQLTADSDRTSLAPGRYQVPSAAVATALGLPVADRGTLTVDWLDESGVRRRHLFEVGDPGKYRIFRNHYYNGSWVTGWVLEADFTSFKPWSRGQLDGTVPLNDIRGEAYEGIWELSSGVAIELSAPVRSAAALEVMKSGTITIQRLTSAEPLPRVLSRFWWNGKWSDWETPNGGATAPEQTGQGLSPAQVAADAMVESVVEVVDPTTDYQTRHAALVSEMTSRVGAPSLGTAGGLALVFDHGTTAFRDWVWPELKKRGLPATLALCPEIHLDGKGDSRHQATNEEIKQWVAEGLAIASHSGDHAGAKTNTDLWRQIVVSKQTLESKLGTPVDAWVQPGYALSGGDYKGFGSGQTAEAYTGTVAGRLLQKTYPVITGYVGDDYLYPGDTPLPVGAQRSAMEKKDSISLVRNYVTQAADKGLKHINFIHPYIFQDTSSTYATKADYLAFLDLVVSLRDAGKLKVLTLPQLAVAGG